MINYGVQHQSPVLPNCAGVVLSKTSDRQFFFPGQSSQEFTTQTRHLFSNPLQIHSPIRPKALIAFPVPNYPYHISGLGGSPEAACTRQLDVT